MVEFNTMIEKNVEIRANVKQKSCDALDKVQYDIK